MITARDVAAELGISISTVGRAMADDPRISSETRARVQKAAQKLGYIGNSPARIMRGASSKLIGLLLPDVANVFYASIAQAMSDCVDRYGFQLVLALTQDDRKIETRQVRELIGARAAGIIIVPTAKPAAETRIMLGHAPYVQFLRRAGGLQGSWFGIDDADAIQHATGTLIERGHRRIAYIGGEPALSTGQARQAGYRRALAAAGIPEDTSLEYLGAPVTEFGFAAASRLLDSAELPTAIVTGSFHITQGVVAAIEERRIAIPRKLSLIGFGNAPWYAWWRGGLSTVVPPVTELATSCALWFIDHIRQHQAEPAESHHAIVHSTFLPRATVGPPRVA